MREKNNLLKVQDLSIQFNIEQERFPVVKNISFCIQPAEVVGIIGESGCGKSITAFSLLKLLPSKKFSFQGRVEFQGNRIDNLPAKKFYTIRGRKISMIFQDPLSCFNPVVKIQDQLLEVWSRNKQKLAMEKIIYLFSQVGFTDYKRILHSYPHQLSGGMRQRVMIAMSLLYEPPLLIADEPTTALDTTVQLQTLCLLKKLQQEKKMSLLLITHDLGVIAQMCDFVYVMYFGEIVEQGTILDIFSHPAHPYTKDLVDIVLQKHKNKFHFIKGRVPRLQENFKGCSFAARCTRSKAKCWRQSAKLNLINKAHFAACHFPYTDK